MLRRPALLALLAIILRTAASDALAADYPAAGRAVGATPAPVPAAVAAACRGVALERFERGLPTGTRRHVVGSHLAPPFAQLWMQAQTNASPQTPAAGALGQAEAPGSTPGSGSGTGMVTARPRSGPPAVPDAVTVYTQGANQPLLVAYRAGGCVLAVLTLPRDRLWRVLREQLGQSV